MRKVFQDKKYFQRAILLLGIQLVQSCTWLSNSVWELEGGGFELIDKTFLGSTSLSIEKFLNLQKRKNHSGLSSQPDIEETWDEVRRLKILDDISEMYPVGTSTQVLVDEFTGANGACVQKIGGYSCYYRVVAVAFDVEFGAKVRRSCTIHSLQFSINSLTTITSIKLQYNKNIERGCAHA